MLILKKTKKIELKTEKEKKKSIGILYMLGPGKGCGVQACRVPVDGAKVLIETWKFMSRQIE